MFATTVRNTLLLGSGGFGCLLLLSVLGGSSLGLSGLGLVNQSLGLDGLSLSLVDGLDQDTLVLKHVTLGSEVEEMIDVVIDLSLLTILAKKSTENSLSSDPEDLSGHTSLSGTSALAGALMATLTLGLEIQSNASSRVHSDWLLDDETILDELSDGLSGGGGADLRRLVGIEPNTTLSALGNGSSKASLKLQR